jgi:hypothetical protein
MLAGEDGNLGIMPQRILKSQILHSERWNRVSYAAQSLFIRLLTVVDDDGRFEANPRLLASLLMPYGEPSGRVVNAVKMDAWLTELASADMLALYVVAENRYLEVKRWTERRRATSKYPSANGTSAFAHGSGQSLASAGKCQQVPSDVVTPEPTPNRHRTDIEERGGSFDLKASTVQWAALEAEIKELTVELGAESDDSRKRQLRQELGAKKMAQKKLRAKQTEVAL